MASDLILSSAVVEQALTLSERLSSAQVLPEALHKKPADILALVLAGAELGLGPMQSIRGLVLIDGKPTLRADAIAAIVQRRTDVCEYLRLTVSNDKEARYETKRKGHPAPITLGFTIEEATQAELLKNPAWRKYRPAMLRARAVAVTCRAVYSDLLLGIPATEEVADYQADKQQEVVVALPDLEPPQADEKSKRRALSFGPVIAERQEPPAVLREPGQDDEEPEQLPPDDWIAALESAATEDELKAVARQIAAEGKKPTAEQREQRLTVYKRRKLELEK